jgi:hypothetical protein
MSTSSARRSQPHRTSRARRGKGRR